MNKQPESILENWGTRHVVITTILCLVYPGVFAFNLITNGSDALPWDYEILVRHGVHDVSVVGSAIFAILHASVLTGTAFCITGIVLGPKSLDWTISLFSMILLSLIVHDAATYAEVYLWA